jgi:hypothetical protein
MRQGVIATAWYRVPGTARRGRSEADAGRFYEGRPGVLGLRVRKELVFFSPGGKVKKTLAHSFEPRFKSRIAMV